MRSAGDGDPPPKEKARHADQVEGERDAVLEVSLAWAASESSVALPAQADTI